MKRRTLIVTLVLLIVFITLGILITLIPLKEDENKSNIIIGNVNGMSIYYGELYDQMKRDKTIIISQYSKKYNANVNDKDFWNTEFENKTPIEALREYSAKSVKRYKLKQQLAVKNNIIKKSETDYNAFLKLKNKENENRAKGISEGQRVYGAKNFDNDSFYKYYQSIIDIKLIGVLSEKGKELFADEKQLKEYYNSIKNVEYKKSPIAEYEDYYILFDNAEDSSLTKKQAKAIAEKVRELVKTNSDYKEVIKNSFKNVNVSSISLNENTERQIQKEMLNTYSVLIDLKVGENSDIMELQNSFHIFKCIKYKSGGYKSFKENKDSVMMQYRQNKYDEMLDEICDKYIVNWNNEYYKVSLN